MSAIRTIETDPESPFGEPEIPAAEWTLRHVIKEQFGRGLAAGMAWLARGGISSLPKFPQGQSLERTVVAYVNHGRWLWDCGQCGAAQACTPNDPRAFCVGCFNGGDGWWPVEFPAEMRTIETLLERRPRDAQRNWQPPETIDQLQLENLSIGVDPDLPDRQWPGAQKALAVVRNFRTRELKAAE